MNKDAFSGFHPAVNLAFFLAALSMTMVIQHPVYLLISMVFFPPPMSWKRYVRVPP